MVELHKDRTAGLWPRALTHTAGCSLPSRIPAGLRPCWQQRSAAARDDGRREGKGIPQLRLPRMLVGNSRTSWFAINGHERPSASPCDPAVPQPAGLLGVRDYRHLLTWFHSQQRACFHSHLELSVPGGGGIQHQDLFVHHQLQQGALGQLRRCGRIGGSERRHCDLHCAKGESTGMTALPCPHAHRNCCLWVHPSAKFPAQTQNEEQGTRAESALLPQPCPSTTHIPTAAHAPQPSTHTPLPRT